MRSSQFEQPFCKSHNQLAQFVNPDQSDKTKPFVCANCLNLKIASEFINEKKENFQKIQLQYDQRLDKLYQFCQSMRQFQEKLSSNINKIINFIDNQLQQLKSQQMNFSQKVKQPDFIEMELIFQENKNQSEAFEKSITHPQIQIKNLKGSFDSLLKNNLFIGIDIQEKKYQYQQLPQSLQQNFKYYAIDINSNNSTVAAGCDNKIRLLEFLDENLKDLQYLEGHSKEVLCLKFMKKSQQLISGCSEGKIIIWGFGIQKIWQSTQTLNDHSSCIICLQINLNEDLIISGSQDKTIKFWKFDQKSWKCVQTLQMENYVLSLSLNESNTKLIVSIFNLKLINLIELVENQWRLIQKIQIQKDALRLCFLNDNKFALQLYSCNQLQILKYDQKNNQYYLEQEIPVEFEIDDYDFFPMQFIQSKGILIDKNCKFINVLHLQQNEEYTLDQSINLGHRCLFGCVSEDGQYLLTWDMNSNQIQIRKLLIS